MKTAQEIINPYLTNLETFGVPKHLTNVVSEGEAIRLIILAQNEAILECAEIVNNMAKELEIHLDTKPILDLIQKI